MHSIASRALSLTVICCLTSTVRSHAQTPAETGLWLRPGDAIRVEVKDEPDLRGDYAVDIDGFVLMPGVGRVGVTDRAFDEVRPDLLAAYSMELSEPVVQITPLIRLAVLGQVREPGLYMVDRTHTFSDVLALAGGLSESADPNRISLMRDGQLVTTVPQGLSGGVDVRLRSGDQVVVGRLPWYRENSQILIGAITSVATAAITSLIIR